MLLYDSLTCKKEAFFPLREPVALYVCGITPYDTTHLGHAFTYGFYDVLIRYLRYRGHQTRYVQNVTDVDDDIFKKARELGVEAAQLASEQTGLYQEDMAALNVLPPDVFPRASQEIPKIIEIIDALLQKGYAYRSGPNVYFEVRRDPGYGQLSHYDRDEMLPVANERGNDPTDPHKRDPLDFVLWKESGQGEPRWESPWGAGMPGWHIECSAMALRYLGETIDIHGGGVDLVFPHHEGEIAQSEHYTGKHPFVRHWVHVAMVYLEGQKMSKSLGNLVMVRDLLARYDADALRLLLLRHRHTEPWSYEEPELGEASRCAELLRLAAAGPVAASIYADAVADERARFQEAMEDDLDTPRAQKLLETVARRIVSGEPSRPSAESSRRLIKEVASVLGLRLA